MRTRVLSQLTSARPATRRLAGLRWLRWLSIGIGLLLWEFLGRVVDFRFLPPFTEVMVAAANTISNATFWEQFAVSMVSLVSGYAIAAVAGVMIGALMGAYRVMDDALSPYVEMLLAAPKLIFAPVMLSLFGTSRASQLTLIVLYAMPIIVVNTAVGIRTVKRSWVEMARSFGATETQIFIRVLILGARPLLLTGLSLAVSRAVNGMVAGEMFIAFVGVGALLRRYGSRFDVAEVWGILVIIVLLSALLLAAFSRLTRAKNVVW